MKEGREVCHSQFYFHFQPGLDSSVQSVTNKQHKDKRPVNGDGRFHLCLGHLNIPDGEKE